MKFLPKFQTDYEFTINHCEKWLISEIVINCKLWSSYLNFEAISTLIDGPELVHEVDLVNDSLDGVLLLYQFFPWLFPFSNPVFWKKNQKSKPGLIKTFVLFSAFSSQHTQLKAENRNRLNPFLLFEVQIKKCYLNSTTKRKMYFIILGFCSSSVV